MLLCLLPAANAEVVVDEVNSWNVDWKASGIEYINDEVWFIDSRSNCCVNANDPAVYILDTFDGSYAFQHQTWDVPMHDLAWDGNSLWMDGPSTGTIYEMDISTGLELSTIASPAIGSTGLTHDGTTLWSTTGYSEGVQDRQIRKYESGVWIDMFASPNAEAETPHGLAWHDGYLWTTTFSVSNSKSTLYQIDPSDGSVISSFTTPSESYIHDLVWGGGYLWVTSSWTVAGGVQSQIYQLEVTGVPTASDPIDYYCDDDHDYYISSIVSGSCSGIGCRPIGCGTAAGSDCDDGDPVINPDTLWYEDSDGDGYGNPTVAYVQCTQPVGPPDYVLDNSDYDDSDPNIGLPIKITGATTSYHFTLQAAYDYSSNGDIIRIIAESFTEDLSIDIIKSVVFSGGYDGAFDTNIGNTMLNGDINVSNGTLTIENFILQQ